VRVVAESAPGLGVTVSARAVKPPRVVTAEWLSSHINDAGLVVLHVGEEADYAAGHIQGARFVDFTRLAAPRREGGLSLELPPVEQLRSTLESWGISDGSTVVVYWGKDWVSPTTRVVFTLDYVGLGHNTAVLDGGLPEWTKQGRPLTKEAPVVRPGRVTVRPNPAVVADADFVKAHRGKQGWALIDARDTQFYEAAAGSGEGRPGHIPGAVSLPFGDIVSEDLKLLPERELRALFERAGVARGDTVIAYCHVGQQATVVVFGARLLGHAVKLYDGSYQDWQRRTDLPVENGTGKRGEGK
jgi:thiosulfate/3-mercaptopyruvate sulfurtransferase